MDSKIVKWNIYQSISRTDLNDMSKNIVDTVFKELNRYVVNGGQALLTSDSIVSQDTGTNYQTKVAAFWGMDENGVILINPAEETLSHSTPSTNPRVDIIEAQFQYTDQASESRPIIDPVTGAVSSQTVYTEQALDVDIQVTEGSEAASPVAPSKTSGWTKIAEVYVDTSGGIADADITNINSADNITDNVGWTTEKGITKLLKSAFINQSDVYLRYEAISADTDIQNGVGYICTSATKINLTMPATTPVGFRFAVVGQGSGGWIINLQSGQKITRTPDDGGTEIETDSGGNLASYIAGDTVQIVCTVANTTFKIVNDTGLHTYSPNWFGDGSDGNVVISSDTDITSVLDGDMVVKNYVDLTIDAGYTLSVSNRCKGFLIYCQGDLVVNGTISMTGKGPAVAGTSDHYIRRLKSGQTESGDSLMTEFGTAAVNAEANQPTLSSNGKTYNLKNAGGSAGTANGGTGGTATEACGGGGGGGGGSANGGNGSVGRLFGGGGGGGGGGSNTGSAASAAGQGGTGGTGANGGLGEAGGGGGAGGTGGGTSGYGGTGPTASAGSPGAGGVLVIIVRGDIDIGTSGSIEADGTGGGGGGYDISNAGGGGGAGSGGGRVLILYGGSITITGGGSVSAYGGNGGPGRAAGGTNGGNGGAGATTQEQIDS